MIFNVTVTGTSHKEVGKECQDYSLTWQNRSGSIRIAAVSDGHGGEEYTNSSLGARLACEVAVKTMREFAGHIRKIPPHRQAFHVKTLTSSILTRWNDGVELLRGPDTVKSFGCTLIAYLQTPGYWLAIQIGDGKFVSLSDPEGWTQPVPWDDRCILNFTTSMCDENALDEFRFKIGYKTPLGVFLSSDGVDATFEDGELLYNFFSHIIKSLNDEGAELTFRELPRVLSHFSEVGSKDDMSVAVIINPYTARMEEFIPLIQMTHFPNNS